MIDDDTPTLVAKTLDLLQVSNPPIICPRLSSLRNPSKLACMPEDDDITRIRIRLYFDNGSMFGPGKADLLALIEETGSIAAAGRALQMSYKRAWGLVEAMNAMFRTPVVESSRGGAKHGGATLTDTGRRVLALYRNLETNTRSATKVEIRNLEDLLGEPQSTAADGPGTK
jgi:molybdate transport system regulatory protein